MSELFLKHDLRGVIINSWDTFRLIFDKWSREIDENNSLVKNAFSKRRRKNYWYLENVLALRTFQWVSSILLEDH